MNSEDKHIFVEFSVQENMKDTFARRWICFNCRLERLQSKRGVNIYSRNKIIFSEDRIPDCFGSIPINDQTIDR